MTREELRLAESAVRLFNTVIFGAPGSDINSSGFGQVTSQANGNTNRVMQFGLRFMF